MTCRCTCILRCTNANRSDYFSYLSTPFHAFHSFLLLLKYFPYFSQFSPTFLIYPLVFTTFPILRLPFTALFRLLFTTLPDCQNFLWPSLLGGRFKEFPLLLNHSFRWHPSSNTLLAHGLTGECSGRSRKSRTAVVRCEINRTVDCTDSNARFHNNKIQDKKSSKHLLVVHENMIALCKQANPRDCCCCCTSVYAHVVQQPRLWPARQPLS